MKQVVTYALSEQECEEIAEAFDIDASVHYEDGLVKVRLPPTWPYKELDFTAVFRAVKMLRLSYKAVAIYEQRDQCFAEDSKILVIDDISYFETDGIN